MKKRQLKEWLHKPSQELEKEIIALVARRADLAFRAADGKISTVGEVRKIKKSIAQLKTIAVALRNQ